MPRFWILVAICAVACAVILFLVMVAGLGSAEVRWVLRELVQGLRNRGLAETVSLVLFLSPTVVAGILAVGRLRQPGVPPGERNNGVALTLAVGVALSLLVGTAIVFVRSGILGLGRR